MRSLNGRIIFRIKVGRLYSLETFSIFIVPSAIKHTSYVGTEIFVFLLVYTYCTLLATVMFTDVKYAAATMMEKDTFGSVINYYYILSPS